MRANPTDLLISGSAVHTGQETLSPASVHIQGRIIGEIYRDLPKDFKGRRIELPGTYHLVPGRIDMHIHGAGGADVMDATPAALNQIRRSLAAEGVTGFLTTTVTESVEKITQALQNVALYQKNCAASIAGADILGIHLEGPFISPQHAGAHRKELILAPDIKLFDHWQTIANGHIRLVTLAPELPGGLEFIRHLRQRNVIASIGHTDADYKVTQLAAEAGAQHATHLFNAMRPFHHREPGCIGAILQNKQIRAEIIADGHHCHPAALAFALSLKGVPGLVLVTDAMRAKGCDRGGRFDLGGQEVIIQDGAARLQNGVLAGSILTMTQGIKNMLRFTECTLDDLIQLTSINPAQALNLDTQKGCIIPGKDADLTVLDQNLDVILTISKGQIIYQREGLLC